MGAGFDQCQSPTHQIVQTVMGQLHYTTSMDVDTMNGDPESSRTGKLLLLLLLLCCLLLCCTPIFQLFNS